MREMVIDAWNRGMAIEEIAEEFGYEESWVIGILEEEHLICD